MKITQTPVKRDVNPVSGRDEHDGAQHYVIHLSERNVRNLMAQIEMSTSAGAHRKPYGTLLKRFETGDIMVLSIEADEDHYDDDGVAR